MKEMLKNKFSEHPFERFMFYLAFVYGIVIVIWLMNRIDEYQQAELYIQLLIVAGLIVIVRHCYNMLWWFGDHPEE